MELFGLELIKAYRRGPERFFPMYDRTGNTPAFNEYGEHNVGWNAGMLDDRRPFFAECWAVDGITMLTVYVSAEGLEDASEEKLLDRVLASGYFRFRGGGDRSCELSSFSDPQGRRFHSLNITAGIGDGPSLIEGAPILPWSVLNEYNRENAGAKAAKGS